MGRAMKKNERKNEAEKEKRDRWRVLRFHSRALWERCSGTVTWRGKADACVSNYFLFGDWELTR